MILMVIILILLLMIVVMMSMFRTAVPELRLFSIPLPGTKGSEAKLQVRCFSLCLTKLKKIISRSCFLRVIETLTKLPSPQSFRCEQSSWPLTIIELGIFFISYALLQNFHLFAFRVLVSKSYIKTCKSQVCKTFFNVWSC